MYGFENSIIDATVRSSKACHLSLACAIPLALLFKEHKFRSTIAERKGTKMT